ncbi:MAG: molybdopterin converting factor subunit 1 [Chloroflexi bacterium]|nr:molybdopterin converting factor subunit 1 [Chloroflexota bacterium]
MRVRVRLFASQREVVGQRELELDMPGGSTASDVLSRLTSEYPRLAGVASSTMLAVNREYVDQKTKLKEGDEVALLPPVSGGTDV